jgi:hypothetical protein
MRRAAPIVIVCMLLAPLVRAEQAIDPAERLRAEIALRPTDARPRCELAFMLVRRSQFREAVEIATSGIALVRRRTDSRGIVTLAACLYNRGRAHEGLGQRKLAVTDYADSLDLRPNPVVRARLLTLAPNVPENAPLVALIETLDGARTLPSPARTIAVTAADDTRFTFVTDDRGPSPSAFAVARICGEARVASIDEAFFDNYGTLTIESAEARSFGDVQGVLVTVRGGGDVTCGRMDGVMDGEHEATVVVFAENCRLRAATFVRLQTTCDGADEGLSVRFDGEGNAITSRRGRLRAERIGRFRLRTIAD